MGDQEAINLAMFIFRSGIGAVMLAHGVNHIFGGGRIEGTAGWFGSMGMRRPLVQAWLASITEIVVGILLVLGLFTPFAAAGVIGVMAVAFAINHRGNGFFIFRPGEGWEYVLTLALCGVILGALGPGEWSIDHAIDLTDDLTGWSGLLIAAIAGLGGAGLLLAGAWRPEPAEDTSE
jgi:putative oxidoreductase